ncbi:MAG: class I SAM-dependent methyltransferase [Thermodesulfobacteriota bacterium]
MEEPIRTEPGTCALCGATTGAPLARGWDFEYLTTRTEFTFWRCACGGVFLSPRPAPESLGRVYPSNYYSYDFANKLGPTTMRFKAFADRAKVKAYAPYLFSGARVLDVGCGDGHVLRQIRDAVTSPVELEGVEFSEQAVAAARRDGFRVYQGAIEDVALPADSFDLIIMNQLIEHVREPRIVLERMRAALKPGGHLFVETPNIDSLDARLFRRRYWGGYHLPRHFHLFDTRSLARLVELAGLERVAHRPLVCPQFWIISLQNWLKDRGAVRFAERALNPFNPVLLAPVTVLEMAHQRLWWTSNQQLVARRAS